MMNGGHYDVERNVNEAREVIWDEGMPQETREIVYPGHPNYHFGKPIPDSPFKNYYLYTRSSR